MEGTVNEQENRQLMATRIVDEQVGRIAAEFKAQCGITLETRSTPDGVAYEYAADQLLVQETDLPGVLAALGDPLNTGPVEDVIAGVKLVHFGTPHPYAPAPPAPDIVDRIEKTLGPGKAAPNYVLTVAPGGPCPATEPVEVYFGSEPFPGERMEDDNSNGAGVRIYIADTGKLADAASHPWLRGVGGQPDPLEPRLHGMIKPYAGHGTFVAGVARCMAPESDVFVSNVFKVAGSSLESDFVRDLDAALSRGVDIFNLSVTTRAKADLKLLGFEAWLKRLEQYPQTVCVVAAGNDNSRQKFWPAAYSQTGPASSQIVSVGALAADWRTRASFSNYGDWVKVFAPGRDLVNAYTMGTYECRDAPYTGQLRQFYGMAKWSGTSFSTPLVAGLIAARKSRTGGTAQQAAESLLADAKSQEVPGLGAIVLPYGNKFTI
jgi:subtilisin family serine protease